MDFQKKLLFLEGILLYVIIIIAVTESVKISTVQTEQTVAVTEGDSDNSEMIDPYKEVNKKVALTFDDGPDPQYTPILLDGLKERNVQATFFVLGKQAEKYPEIIERMESEGHLIGNHTYSHVQLRNSNQAEFKEELQKTEEIIEGITRSQVQYVRPPYGTWDKSIEEELNLFPVLWDVDPLDWCKKDVVCMVRNVIADVEENDIILMHDQYSTSVEAALLIIDELQQQGYEFVTVEELLIE